MIFCLFRGGSRVIHGKYADRHSDRLTLLATHLLDGMTSSGGERRVRTRPRSTPTHEGAWGHADFAGCIGRADFDPTLPSVWWKPARIFDAIVISGSESRGYQVNRSTSIDLITPRFSAESGRSGEDHAGLHGQPGRDGPAGRAV